MKYFGTDGYRGKVNEGLLAINAFKLGQGFGQLVKKNANGQSYVYIGQDTRLSCDMLVMALVAGINSVGVNTHLLKVVTTPLLAYATNADKNALGAIMVSASHNPYYDNGLKCFNSQGFKLDVDSENYIEKVIDGEIEVSLAIDDQIGSNRIDNKAIDNYVHNVLAYINQSFNYRVVLDCANGATYELAPRLFKLMGFDVIVMNDHPNGININDNCGSTHLEFLKEAVVREKADFGFAFDGDGDRVLAVDEFGQEVTGDHILYQMAKYFQVEIVTTVMANYGLVAKMREQGQHLQLCPVGDKYVYEELVKKNLNIGGEQSGHIIFRDFNQTGDGIFVALLICQMLYKQKQKLSVWVDELPIFPQVLVNCRVNDKESILNNNHLWSLVNEIEEKLDGDGRILVRASGTEPLIRVMVEAPEIKICQDYVDRVVSFINSLSV